MGTSTENIPPSHDGSGKRQGWGDLLPSHSFESTLPGRTPVPMLPMGMHRDTQFAPASQPGSNQVSLGSGTKWRQAFWKHSGLCRSRRCTGSPGLGTGQDGEGVEEPDVDLGQRVAVAWPAPSSSGRRRSPWSTARPNSDKGLSVEAMGPGGQPASAASSSGSGRPHLVNSPRGPGTWG